MLFIAVAFYCLLALAIPLSHKPVHKVTVRSHSPELVASMLYKTYADVFALAETPKTLSVLNSQSIFLQLSSKPECVEQSLFRYFLDTVKLILKDYPASECRMNTNERHLSVLKPAYNFHATVHGSLGVVHDELVYKSQTYIELLPIPHTGFYNYSGLDYNMECLARHHELMQIMYHETLVEVALKMVVQVPEKCSFGLVNRAFGNEYTSAVKVEIPVNATLECHSGSSPTCRVSTALTRNTRYKHLE